ncbi:MAG: GerW family sporulation protein [Oscillospiraceae bacterium]
MSTNKLNETMQNAMENIKKMVDVDTIIGTPMDFPDGTHIIPVSKVSFGFGSGGSDIPTKSEKELFGGATGAGITIQPIAFIVIKRDGDVKLLQMSVNASKENAIINTVPEVIDKISDIFSKDKEKKSE